MKYNIIGFITWFIIGGSFTIFDELHIKSGIIEHNNFDFVNNQNVDSIINSNISDVRHANVVHNNFPFFFSPNFAFAGLIFYTIHKIIFGINSNNIFGGKDELIFEEYFEILQDFLIQTFISFICYYITTLCGIDTYLSIFILMLLYNIVFLNFYYNCWLRREFFIPILHAKSESVQKLKVKSSLSENLLFLKRFIYFALIAICIGIGFELFMTHQEFGFKYPMCEKENPDFECLGTSVPIILLIPLYLQSCVFMNNIILT